MMQYKFIIRIILLWYHTGQIYQGLDLATKKDVAIKVESKQCPNQLLKMEVTVLNAVQGKWLNEIKISSNKILYCKLKYANLGTIRAL